MIPERPLMVRALGAIAMLTLVGSVIGAITIDNDDGTANVAATSRATTTAVAADTSTTAAPADEGSPALGDDTSSTVNGKATTTHPSTPANIPDPGPTKPPAAGTYHYRVGDPNDTSRASDVAYTVETAPDQNGARVRKETFQSTTGTVTNVVAYATDAVRVLMSTLSAGQSKVECAWTPPSVPYALPLAVGKSWSYDSKCTATVSGGRTTIERKSDDKVVGKAVDIVGNTSVRVWVVQEHLVTTINNPFFSSKVDESFMHHWSPDYGLVTFEHEDITNNGGSPYVVERTLQNLKP